MMVQVDADEIATLRAEKRRLAARVDELLAANTALVEQRRRIDRRAMVREFFTIAGQPLPERPTIPDEATVRLRLRLVAEEFEEFLLSALGEPNVHDVDAWDAWNNSSAIGHWIDRGPLRIDVADLADSVIDLSYVAEGALVAFGIDSRPLWDEVQRANMAKAGGPRRADGKLGKPDGWEPPRIAEALRAQGWTP